MPIKPTRCPVLAFALCLVRYGQAATGWAGLVPVEAGHTAALSGSPVGAGVRFKRSRNALAGPRSGTPPFSQRHTVETSTPASWASSAREMFSRARSALMSRFVLMADSMCITHMHPSSRNAHINRAKCTHV